MQTLTDGRQVQAAECLSEWESSFDWDIVCGCCWGRGTHPWSPSGHGDSGEYGCQPCGGKGEFPVATPGQN